MIAMATFKFEFSRRQAVVLVREFGAQDSLDILHDISQWRIVDKVPVLAWPNPTNEGCFVVEYQDGMVEAVPPCNLIFLDSKELFDLYDWSTSD